MRTRKLGYTDLYLTPVGLGTWAIGGGDNPYGWGYQDDRESIATIQRALDLGVNWIETAKGYGRGHSEEVVGEAIANQRQKVILMTKCGVLWKDDGSDIYIHLKAKSIKAECESSLKRLKTDFIDVYQIHWPGSDEDIEEGWGAIAELIKEGKVRYGGVSNFSIQQIQCIQTIHPVASIQPPYSMLKRDVEKGILDFCSQNEIGVIVYSPMQAGLLSGKFTRERAAALPEDDWRKNNPDFNEPLLSIHLDLVDKLRPIAARKNLSLPNLVIAWTLRFPEISGAIVGARRPEQIEETVKAMEVKRDEAALREIEILLAEHDARVSQL
jgi:aryl-alcohol dehydrogenase-like predicted oxidoreductase